MRRRLLSILMALCLCITLLPITADATSKTADEAINWVKNQVGHSVGYDDGSGYYQCVEFIQAYYQYLGAGKPSGNGADYASNALPSGWTRTAGGTPQKGDILIYSKYSNTVQQYGHVAIYESDSALYDQDGSVWGGTVKKESKNYRTYTYNYWGCIHPNFATPAPAAPSVSFSPWENSNYTYIGWTDAGIGQQIDVSNGTCSEVGMELYDQSGKLLATARDTNYYHRMFFKVNDECHYTLATGTTYKYKFYAIVNGKKYWGNEGSFKTGGPAPEAAKATIPGKPNVTVNGKDVTVSWKDVSNETSYEVYLIQTPWTWNDVKYSTTTAKDVTKYTFKNVTPGDYKAFVVSKPNDRQSQSEWVPFTVTTTTVPGKPTVSVKDANVTVSWKDVPDETSYDVYLIQMPWGWEDVKYSTSTAKDVTKYTFKDVAPGDYKAFVVSKPNYKQWQSEWVPFTVTNPSPAETLQKPSNPWIKADKNTLDIGENITFTFGADGAESYTLGIDLVGTGRILTPGVGGLKTYRLCFDKSGSYTAFITAVNDAGYADSSKISFTVNAEEEPLAYTVSLDRTSLSLNVGDTITLSASYTPADASVSWTTSDPGVAKVSSGKVTAVGAGTASITAMVGDKSATCIVTVTEKATLQIGTSSLPNATAGQYYSQKLVVNTTEGVSWTVASGSLPSGLTLASNGIISGTPMGDGTFSFTVQASSSVGTDSRAYTLVVDQAAAKRVDVHFSRQNVYHQDQFTDVKANQWFTDTVASAFELGLMKGNSAKTFNPYGDVTVAEAITMAARIHSINATGKESFVQSKTWWQTYLDYAYQNGIISSAYYNSDVTQKATRAQFAEIFASSLPTENLYAMNEIKDNAVPDVSMNSSYAGSVYTLYRAGILTGSDALGSFNPQTFITRAEAATLLSRMAESNNRIEFTLGN